MAGYSDTPLAKKLGLKPGRAIVIGEPDGFRAMLGPGAVDVVFSTRLSGRASYIHLFVTRRSDLDAKLARAERSLDTDGMLWISWPKKASGVASDLDGNVVREAGLAAGLVDVKIAAIDDVWSALKFVRRLIDR